MGEEDRDKVREREFFESRDKVETSDNLKERNKVKDKVEEGKFYKEERSVILERDKGWESGRDKTLESLEQKFRRRPWS